MRVCVVGLWHLGCVTAACLAARGHSVVGLSDDAETVSRLQMGMLPLYEPDLEEMVRSGLTDGRLRFTQDAADAVRDAEVVWIAYDTPVDDEDRADLSFVTGRVRNLFPELADGTLVLISSQLPAGTTRQLEDAFAVACPGKTVTFAYSPENLRLGRAISAFLQPDRVVVGARTEADRQRIESLLSPITDSFVWMSVESAEMTKHAINAFLAMSVSFANEIASLCEHVGADAREVEKGLKSERRIGPGAYLSPGAAFAGGTLARDVQFLSAFGKEHGVPAELIPAILSSNDQHKRWAQRKLSALLGSLQRKRLAVWGLTYKPGTDTLRRSSSVELCEWLVSQGAEVSVHDPAVKSLPSSLENSVVLCEDPLAAAQGAEALVVSTQCPVYRTIDVARLRDVMARPLVVDPGGFLSAMLGALPGIEYLTVGKPL